jgi:hypothetical protein
MKQDQLAPVLTVDRLAALLDELQSSFEEERIEDFLNNLCLLQQFLLNCPEIPVDHFNERHIPLFLVECMQAALLVPFYENFVRILGVLVRCPLIDFSELADPAFYDFMLLNVYQSIRATQKVNLITFLIDFLMHDQNCGRAFFEGNFLNAFLEIYDTETDECCRHQIADLFITIVHNITQEQFRVLEPLTGFLLTKIASFPGEPLSILGLFRAFLHRGGSLAAVALSGFSVGDFFQSCLRADIPLGHQIEMVNTATDLARFLQFLPLFRWEYFLPGLEYDSEEMIVAVCRLSKSVIKASPLLAALSVETPLIPTCLAIAESGSYVIKAAAFRVMKQIVQAVPQLFWQVAAQTNYLAQVSDFLESADDPRLLRIVLESCLYLLCSLGNLDTEWHDYVVSFIMDAEIIARIEALGTDLPEVCRMRRDECLIMFRVAGMNGELAVGE